MWQPKQKLVGYSNRYRQRRSLWQGIHNREGQCRQGYLWLRRAHSGLWNGRHKREIRAQRRRNKMQRLLTCGQHLRERFNRQRPIALRHNEKRILIIRSIRHEKKIFCLENLGARFVIICSETFYYKYASPYLVIVGPEDVGFL
jgi:hypothetical protein